MRGTAGAHRFHRPRPAHLNNPTQTKKERAKLTNQTTPWDTLAADSLHIGARKEFQVKLNI